MQNSTFVESKLHQKDKEPMIHTHEDLFNNKSLNKLPVSLFKQNCSQRDFIYTIISSYTLDRN